MKLFNALLLAGLLLASNGFAQTASLTADNANLAPAGGEVTLQATLAYRDRPAAVGWSLLAPDSWSLVKVGGGSLPQVRPEPGATGALEFAYIIVPEFTAHFTVTLRYPAGASRDKVAATVIVRKDGQIITLTPAPVVFSLP